MTLTWVGVLAAIAASAAAAQDRPAPRAGAATATVIAIPPLATPQVVKTDAGDTWTLANGMADVITSDLKSTNAFIIADSKSVRIPSYPEVTAPAYPQWRALGVKALLSGFVQARSDGRLMVGCYLYDVQNERELTRKGFLVVTSDWRRAGHKCADAAYTQLTGNGPLFDSRVAYVAQSGPPTKLVKRLAVMDLDGTNHTFLTSGEVPALTPRWSPKARQIAYTTFSGGKPHVEMIDPSGKGSHPLLPGGISFSPAFAPDGQSLALSIATNGNTDVFTVNTDGSGLRRLTTSPAIDTGASFSPDGRQIVFSSDRSGTQQLYVMNADGTGQRRVSFGAGEYGSPVWSPDGDRIAFTKMDSGAMRIGVMNANGSEVRILTAGPYDDEPSWGPSGEHLMFQHSLPGTGRTQLFTISVDGGQPRLVPAPQSGSDPSWVARQEQSR